MPKKLRYLAIRSRVKRRRYIKNNVNLVKIIVIGYPAKSASCSYDNDETLRLHKIMTVPTLFAGGDEMMAIISFLAITIGLLTTVCSSREINDRPLKSIAT